MNDEQYLQDLQDSRGLSNITKERYRNDLGHYTNYHKMTLDEVISEAEKEEENRIRMRNRKIKKRLIDFQKYLKNEGYLPSTIKTIMGHIKSFYRTYEIELPLLRTPTVPDNETFHDIPKKEHIKIAASTNNLKHKALILFMSSSGTGTSETLSLTVQDFIRATEKYHHETKINDVLDVLSRKKGLIPFFTFKREKTNYQYYTFCSPEATEALILYLKSRNDSNPDSQLFDITQMGLVKMFQRINDKYQWPRKGSRRFFTAHSLRKFFATELTKTRLDHLIIEWMLGHSIPPTTAAYYKSDPESLRFEYLQVVDSLSISRVEVHDIKSDDYLKLEKHLEERDNEIKDIKSKLADLEDLVKVIDKPKVKKALEDELSNYSNEL